MLSFIRRLMDRWNGYFRPYRSTANGILIRQRGRWVEMPRKIDCAALRRKWEARVHPLPEKQIEVPFHRTFTATEIKSLQRGLLPVKMEERWVVLLHEHFLNCYRSSSGDCIYSLPVQHVEAGLEAGPLRVNGDETQYHLRGSDADEARFVETLISQTLERPYEHQATG